MNIPKARVLRNVLDTYIGNFLITILPGILIFYKIEYIPFLLILLSVYWLQQFAFWGASTSPNLYIRVMESNTLFNILWSIMAWITFDIKFGSLYAATMLLLPIGSIFVNPLMQWC